MRGIARSALVLTLAFGVVFATGCGIEEFYTDMGEGALPGDPLNPLVPEVDCQGEFNCECTGGGTGECQGVTLPVDDLAGLAYRFDALTLTAPLTGPIADGLNGYFSDEIAAGTFNVLLVFDEEDREARVWSGRTGAGVVSGSGYAFDGEPAPIGGDLCEAELTTTEPSSIAFPAAPLNPPALPLQAVRLSAEFGSGGATLIDGVLLAALSEEDAAAIKLGAQDLAAFLTTLTPADLDLDEDGVNDAWQFSGTFTATQIELR